MGLKMIDGVSRFHMRTNSITPRNQFGTVIRLSGQRIRKRYQLKLHASMRSKRPKNEIGYRIAMGLIFQPTVGRAMKKTTLSAKPIIFATSQGCSGQVLRNRHFAALPLRIAPRRFP